MGDTRGFPARWRDAAAWAAVLGIALTVYLLRLDQVCGLFVDDGWYVILAKALATGRGYTLISAPSPGMVPFYPPGFSFVLSLVFRVAPSFPDNVWLLKSVSIAAMLGVAVLTERYGVEVLDLSRRLALAVALAVALQGAFVFFATSTVMSECFFTFVQLLTVVVAERVARGRNTSAWLGVGALAGFAFLVRGFAVALVAAIGLVLLKDRRWRALPAFALGVALVAGPWMVHSRRHAPTPAQQAEMNDYILCPYSTQFWMKVAAFPSYGVDTAADLPARAWRTGSVVATRVVGGLEAYPLFQFLELDPWKWNFPAKTPLSLFSCAIVLVGLVSAARSRVGVADVLVPLTLLMTVLWPFLPYRFVLPVLPFVLAYTALGVRTLVRVATGADGRTTALVTVLALAGLSVAGHVLYLRHVVHGRLEDRPRWLLVFDEELALARWLRDHVPPDEIVATINAPFVYLYSGHRTVGYWQVPGAVAEWRRLGIRYFAGSSGSVGWQRPVLPPGGRYPVVYRSPTSGLVVLDMGVIHGR